MSYYAFTKGQAVQAAKLVHGVPVGRKGKVIGCRDAGHGPEYLVKFERKGWPVSCLETDLTKL